MPVQRWIARKRAPVATLTTTLAPVMLCRYERGGAQWAGWGPGPATRTRRQLRGQMLTRLSPGLHAWACLQDTISKQVLSTVPSPPRVRFGTSKRAGMAEKTDAPGPGAYKLKPVMGEVLGGAGLAAAVRRFHCSCAGRAHGGVCIVLLTVSRLMFLLAARLVLGRSSSPCWHRACLSRVCPPRPLQATRLSPPAAARPA